jgi:hypothetical protein
MNPDTERLNPDIKEIKIGVRRLRKIKIYPLSAKDQFELSDLVAGGLKHFLSLGQNMSNVDFVKESLGLIRDNLDRIIRLVTEPKDVGDDVLSDLTNNQIAEIAEIIYEVNYASLQKKVTGLLKHLPSSMRRSSPGFFGDTPNIDLSISTEEVSDGEDSLSDKSERSTTIQKESDGMI